MTTFDEWYASLPTMQEAIATAPRGMTRVISPSTTVRGGGAMPYLCPYFPDCATHRQAMVRALDLDVYP